MKRITSFIVLTVLLFAGVTPAIAQGVPYVIDSTRPISSELRGWLDDWLAVDPPSDAPYYIVTYTRSRGMDTLVSLVGVASAEWSLDEDAALWMGTVVVDEYGEVSPFSQEQAQARKAAGLMSVRMEAGGGSYVMFPFAQGTVAQFGILGVHGEGEYGTSGMVFIDLVSGDDMGATAAPPNVYAADAGTIDYVCDDGISVAVRTYNETTDDYFLYAHLLDNANLEIDEAFGQGELIGALKYGTYTGGSPSCGSAQQHANHYHVHWGFVPAAGMYQVGSCILTLSTQVWQCGDKTVKVGDFLAGGGGYGEPGNTNNQSGTGTAVKDPTFFDYILAGIVGLVSRSIFDLLPAHQPLQYTYVVKNIAELFFRLVYVFVQSNLALRFPFLVILYALGLRAAMLVFYIPALILRVIKWLVPVFGA